MKMRTVMAMVAACFAYILLVLPLTRVRAQVRPAALAMPESTAIPAMPALPAMPGNFTRDARRSGWCSAQPVVPAPPAVPAEQAWGEHVWGSTHWGDGPAADCSDLHIRLNDERPTNGGLRSAR